MDTIYTKLIDIQSRLKAPKDLKNNFAGFDYRSAEKILEAVKPLLKENGLFIKLSDDVKNIGVSNYIQSVATISNGIDSISTSAFAREEVSKKGMDAAQITGSASSYARKYALNGLFAIDDTKDPDSLNNATVAPKKVVAPIKEQKDSDPVTPLQKQQLKNMMSASGISPDLMVMKIETVLNKQTVDTFEDFNKVVTAIEETA